jgi:hypothetical protein
MAKKPTVEKQWIARLSFLAKQIADDLEAGLRADDLGDKAHHYVLAAITVSADDLAEHLTQRPTSFEQYEALTVLWHEWALHCRMVQQATEHGRYPNDAELDGYIAASEAAAPLTRRLAGTLRTTDTETDAPKKRKRKFSLAVQDTCKAFWKFYQQNRAFKSGKDLEREYIEQNRLDMAPESLLRTCRELGYHVRKRTSPR